MASAVAPVQGACATDRSKLEKIFRLSDKNWDGGLDEVRQVILCSGRHEFVAETDWGMMEVEKAGPPDRVHKKPSASLLQGEVAWLIKAVNPQTSLTEGQVELIIDEVRVVAVRVVAPAFAA